MKFIVNRNQCPRNHKCPSIPVCPGGAIMFMVSAPTTILIDKGGYIVTGAQGAVDTKALKK